MANPIDVFREQRAVAGEVYATLKDVAALLSSLKEQADGLIPIHELRELLDQERAWLLEAQRTLSQIRDLRASELLRPRMSRLALWTATLAFALASAVAVGAGYAWVTKPYATELAELRAREEFAEFVERRFITMTPTERRQLDTLMKWSPSGKH
jgi:hypothetical protein